MSFLLSNNFIPIPTYIKCLRVLGTPNEEVWPGVTALQDWNDDFPVWPSLQIGRFVTNINADGVDLIEVNKE